MMIFKNRWFWFWFWFLEWFFGSAKVFRNSDRHNSVKGKVLDEYDKSVRK